MSKRQWWYNYFQTLYMYGAFETKTGTELAFQIAGHIRSLGKN
jgi:hypothetical protein